MILTLVTALMLAQSKAPPPKTETLIGVGSTWVGKEDLPEVLIVFRGGPAEWKTVLCDPKETPTKVHWKVCGGGEVDSRALPPSTNPDEEVRAGTVHRLSGKKARLPAGEPILTTGPCANVDGWKPVQDKAIDEDRIAVTPAMAAAFGKLYGEMAKSLDRPAPRADPKSLRVDAIWTASDGRRLLKVSWRQSPSDEYQYPYDTLSMPIWVMVQKNGAAKPLEIGHEILEAADLDGDGLTDFLFAAHGDQTERYILRPGASANRYLWENSD